MNVLLAFAILLANLALNRPLFLPGEMPFRDSIEGGYASSAHFVSDHPNPWGWNPTQYCGLPVQFTYLPALPYATAALVRLFPNLEPDYAYRLLTAASACLGPVTLFFFVLYFTRNRWWALGAALACTVFSPSYGLIRTIEKDRGLVQLPWRIQVLAKYGEGPHITGLTLLPLGLIALWAASERRKYARILTAAIVLAAIALLNWVAALATAFCGLALLLTLTGTTQAGKRLAAVAGAGGLAYLFACFWLTPSFIKTIAFNWPVDAFNYHLQHQQLYLLAGLAAGLLLIRVVFLRFPGESYFCLLCLGVFGFGWVVLWFYGYGLSTIPESRRYAVEFEMFLLLFLFEALRLTLRSRDRTVRYCALGAAAIMLLNGAGQALAYATQGHRPWTPMPKETAIEHRLARELARQNPQRRVFATGGLRYRLNSWFEIAQVGGTFESGLRNRLPLDFAHQIRTGESSTPGREAPEAIEQLKALGAEYVVVHGPASREHYRDFRNPRKFDGLLEAVYREQDDTIYRLPAAPFAHLVRPEEIPGKPPVGSDRRLLAPYVAALEDAARPLLQSAWRGPSGLDIDGAIPPGMLVTAPVNYDPGWVATQGGRPIPVERNSLGFLTLRVEAGPSQHLELRYRGASEQRWMTVLSGLTWLIALATAAVPPLVARRRRNTR